MTTPSRKKHGAAAAASATTAAPAASSARARGGTTAAGNAAPSPGAHEAPDATAQGAGADTLSKPEVERALRAQLAALTGGLAPDDYLDAWWEWYLRVATEPPRQAALAQNAFEKILDSWNFYAQAAAGAPLAPGREDLGFGDAAWKVWPFNAWAHAYGNWASWWQQALEPASAAADPAQSRLSFAGGLLLQAASPANFLYTNPELLERTAAESGQNLIRGLRNWLEDAERTLEGGLAGSEQFEVGKQVAITPGRVVLRNHLIELLQYSPQTPTVRAEPVLITPAWIMKYYILDLSPYNSLVRYLVGKGHTVFMISWKNPHAADRNLGLEDYVRSGFLAALAEVRRRVPGRKVNAVGYCIGGTLLAIAAAQLARSRERPFASLTLLAAQTDFSEPGELSVFITPSQIAMLEAMMNRSGVLESERMSGAFALLRSRDLLWAPALEQYVRGERPKLNDLMAWNADGTRMPWRMHSEYLERLYLKNELARGEFTLDGVRLDLGAIDAPMFVVGTETDHVAPWRSVYKARALTGSTDYTFLLTSGGHNAGIVSGPEHPRRRHRMLTWSDATTCPAADEWLQSVPAQQGSWWPAWQRWLEQHSSATQERAAPVAPPADAADLGDAPGRYIKG